MFTPPHELERDYRAMASMRAAGAGWCEILQAFPLRRRHLRVMRRKEEALRIHRYRLPDDLTFDPKTLTVIRK